MVVRKFSYKKYILAGLITVLVFSLGIILGLYIETQRVILSEKSITKQRIESNSLQLQNLYISVLGEEKNCNALSNAVSSSLISLENLRERVEDYNKESSVLKEDFNLLVREYNIEQIRFWLLTKEINKLCKTDSVTILNFYKSDALCNDCSKQFFILDYIKKILEQKVYIFSINSEHTEEPMIEILLNTYNVTTSPTLVINDVTYLGLVTQDKLFNAVCNSYKDKPLECIE